MISNTQEATISREATLSAAFPSPAVGWYATILLALLYWLSLLDRTIISLLVDPIKRDLGITDVQFGMLHGLAFAVTFSCFGLVAGSLADRFSRRTIVFVSVAIWSVATGLCGAANNFWQMLVARIGVGAGEAGLNPAATSMITDLFPPSRLNTAMAVYALGASVGAGCAFLFGGALIELVAHTDTFVLPLIGEVRSWQAVFYIIGLPGVLIAFLSYTMPEPRRRGGQLEARGESIFGSIFIGYGQFLKFMASRKRFFFYHYGGFGLASTCFVGGSAWYPAHMGRTFGWDAAQIGLWLGIATVAGGFVGKFLCGFAVDKLYSMGHRDAQFRWFSGAMLVAVPLGVVALTTSSPWLFLVGISLFMAMVAPLTPMYVASLNLVTPNEFRGAGVAFYSATVGLVALSAGPILIAVISEVVFGGNAVGKGMATLIAVCAPLSALLLYRGMSAMREAVAAAPQS